MLAGYIIDEAYAQGRPSVNVNITDTQTSYRTFSAGGGGSAGTISLPGGGQIPTITDSGGGTNAGLTAGGGGGTAPISTNSAGFSNTGGGGTVAPTVGGGAPATNGGAGTAYYAIQAQSSCPLTISFSIPGTVIGSTFPPCRATTIPTL